MMPAPGSFHNFLQDDGSLYETGVIQRLQQRVTQLEIESATLGMNNANLRAEKASLESSLISLTTAIQMKDTHLSKLANQIAISRAAQATAEITAKDFEKKHKDALQSFGALKKAFDAQSAKLEQMERLNITMKAHIEPTPAAPRGQNITSGFPHPLHKSQTHSTSSLAGSFDASTISERYGTETRASNTASALVIRNTSTSQLARSFSEVSLGQRALPPFATAPTSRQVTIRHPDAPSSAAQSTDAKGLPSETTSETLKFTKVYSDVFSSIERFVRKWMIPLGQNQSQTVPPIPLPLKQEANKYLQTSTLSLLWTHKYLRYRLITRFIIEDLTTSYWALVNIPSASENDNVITRIKQIASIIGDRHVVVSPDQRANFVIERAKLISSLSSTSSARTNSIQAAASTHALKIHTRLEQVLSQDALCLKELTNIYIMAGKVFFFIWGNPFDWHFAFPPGGKVAFFNPSLHEAENEEMKGKTGAEIKAMDWRVLLSTTPVITQIGFAGNTMLPSCVYLASTLLSRDGLKLDR